jgi:hypothetical protein
MLNRYMERHRGAHASAPRVVAEAARFVSDTLAMLGMQEFDVEAMGLTRWSAMRDSPQIIGGGGAVGGEKSDSGSGGGGGVGDKAAGAASALDALVQFRGSVRSLALAAVRGAAEGSPERELAIKTLRQCDAVRDALAALQPRCVVRDLPDGSASWHVE